MIEEGKPIRIFFANLLAIGITFKVVNGQLKVGGNMQIMTPVLQEEIIKRASHLIELLAPEVPVELEPFFYRLLRVDELKEAIRVAEVLGISLRQTPVNGGWLIEMQNRRMRKERV